MKPLLSQFLPPKNFSSSSSSSLHLLHCLSTSSQYKCGDQVQPPTPAVGLLSMRGCCLPYTQRPAHTSPALPGWLAPTFLCGKSFHVASCDFHVPGLSGGTVTRTVSVVGVARGGVDCREGGMVQSEYCTMPREVAWLCWAPVCSHPTGRPSRGWWPSVRTAAPPFPFSKWHMVSAVQSRAA